MLRGRQILALGIKDLRLLLRDRSGAFVTFVFPFVYSVFFGLVLGARFEGGSQGVPEIRTSSSPFGEVYADPVAAPASWNGYAISFPQGVIWGVLGCCASFSISIASERTRGTLARLCVAPLSRMTVLAGKALACQVSILSLGAGVFLVGWIGFDVRPSSFLRLGISLVMISWAFVGVMMLLATLGRTERAVSGFTWATLLAMAMIGGGMVPSVFMPPWMQAAGRISPIHWAILSLEGSVWRALSGAEMLTPWFVLLAVGLTCFLLGVRSLNRMEEV